MLADLIRHDVPLLGEPATILGLTILVAVQCRQCDAQETIALVNAQRAACTTCGSVFGLDRVVWDVQQAQPTIALSATPRRREALMS